MNHVKTAMCSNGKIIWCIDTRGVLYEIDKYNNTIKFLYWIDEIKDDSSLKFPLMRYVNGKLIIAPYCGQSFWSYDIKDGRAEHLTDEFDKANYRSFYDYGNSIFFIDAYTNNVAVYDKNNCSIKVKKLNCQERSGSLVGVSGGCRVATGENTIYHALYGTNIIREIRLDDLSVREITLAPKISLALSYKMNDSLILILTSGEICKEKNGEIIKLTMPHNAAKCSGEEVPYHCWARVSEGLILSPCYMNMVILCSDSGVKNIYTVSDESSVAGQHGIVPCCGMEESVFVGCFPIYKDELYEFNVKTGKVNKYTLSNNTNGKKTEELLRKKMARNQTIITEKQLFEDGFCITLRDFLSML